MHEGSLKTDTTINVYHYEPDVTSGHKSVRLQQVRVAKHSKERWGPAK